MLDREIPCCSSWIVLYYGSLYKSSRAEIQFPASQLSTTIQNRNSKKKETSTMNKDQLTTWACGHNQPARGPSPSDNPCSKCKARGADYYRPRQEHRRVDYYRPIYGRRRKESSGVWNARDEERYNQTRRQADDRRKRKTDIRQSQRERAQYEEVRMKRRELVREQDQYEEDRERQQDAEHCPCDRCSIKRREKLNSKIHKWLAVTEELCIRGEFSNHTLENRRL